MRAVGMNDYISKPIDEKLLFDKINESTSALEA
jgi:CheY-like chemotaxis protein